MWFSSDSQPQGPGPGPVLPTHGGKLASRDWVEPIKGSQLGYVVLDVTECVEAADELDGVTVQVDVAASVWRGGQRKNAAAWFTTFILSIPRELGVDERIPEGFVSSFPLAFGETKSKAEVIFASVSHGSPCVDLSRHTQCLSGDRVKRWTAVSDAPGGDASLRTHRVVGCVAFVLEEYSTASLCVRASVAPRLAEHVKA